MRAAGYTRVSTAKQAEKGFSLGEQERALRERAEREGWELELFVERGVSGRKDSRPELDRLLRRVEAGEFDVLVIPRIDRFGRRARRLRRIKEALEDHKVKLVCLDPDLDFDTLAGGIVWDVMIRLAEEESKTIGARVSATAGARAAAGKHYGGPPPYGYEPDPERGLRPNEPEAAMVRRMFEEAANGRASLQIARGLNADGARARRGGEWHGPSVARILRDPTYKGIVRLKGEEFPGVHEPLISEGLWERVEAIRASRARGSGRGRPPAGRHLFTRGLLRCAHCGYAMSPRRYQNRRPGGPIEETYECLGRRMHGPDYCPQTPVPRGAIDAAAFAYFEEVGLDLEATKRQLAAALDARLTQAHGLLSDQLREAAGLQARLDRFDADYGDGKLEAPEWRELRASVLPRLEDTRERAARLSDQIAELETAASADAPAARIEQRLAELRAAATTEDLQAIRAALGRLFERIEISRADLPPAPELPPEWLEARSEILANLGEDQIQAGSWVLFPTERAEKVEGFGAGWRPVLTRESLVILEETNERTG